MTSNGTFSTRRIGDELPELLAERDLSLRELARQVGISHAHLSRALRAADGKVIGADLAQRIALALDLPYDYFPEYREGAVTARVHLDGQLRDRIYRDLKRSG